MEPPDVPFGPQASQPSVGVLASRDRPAAEISLSLRAAFRRRRQEGESVPAPRGSCGAVSRAPRFDTRSLPGRDRALPGGTLASSSATPAPYLSDIPTLSGHVREATYGRVSGLPSPVDRQFRRCQKVLVSGRNFCW